jgi:Tat protein secretion system quality control protein TatD with DNase activity
MGWTRVTEEQKEQLTKMKTLKSSKLLPEDLQISINTFIKQAVIIGEYGLDSMPPEYVNNLIDSLTKYPEFDFLTRELLEILEKEIKPTL